MDIAGLIEQLKRDAVLSGILNNRRSQFGTPARRYVGAEILPERNTDNKFREDQIKYRSMIANDSTRYSPVQLKQGHLIGSFDVELSESDIGAELTGKDWDALLDILVRAGGANPSPQAAAQVIRWADTQLNVPLIEKNEKMRWEAIVDAAVVRTGDNGFQETISYPNPTGHRFAAAGAWSNNAVDPMVDITAGMNKLAEKGYRTARIIAGQPVISKLQNNQIMAQRAGILSLAGGSVVGRPSQVSFARLNEMLGDEELPPITRYNLQYRYQSTAGIASSYFLKRDVFVMIGETDESTELDLGDTESLLLEGTIGYTAIGRPAGSTVSERRQIVWYEEQKPPGLRGQAWQTSLPVITDPESVVVIHTIT